MHLGDLLDHQCALQESHAVSPELLVDAKSKKTELGHLEKDFLAPVLVLFVFLHIRFDFVFGKILGHVLKHLLFFG